MSNQLKMATIQSILALRAQRWSFRRISTQLGIHRETVARYVRQAESKTGQSAPRLSDAESDPRARRSGCLPAQTLGTNQRADASGNRRSDHLRLMTLTTKMTTHIPNTLGRFSSAQ